ncbi:potassium transporter Kup [Desulforhabdus amnigena]|uniref:potassium transporter Kup n=1 Tax=Desulforhabdus amnigena TaxID=40218 RepID=UPI0016AE635C|nr:KUP/HAK/KT family potassium transporter [Desulforhabdus amnigena]NLJ26390.1 potassium transporter Kup [Deltaproteobacteria bacterium]
MKKLSSSNGGNPSSLHPLHSLESSKSHPSAEIEALNSGVSPRARTLALALGALGVVYGDIGTSPLYAVKECFHGLHAIALNTGNILGVLSLIFWSLTMVVSIKYVAFILRADNNGEGGIYALLALIPVSKSSIPTRIHSAVVIAAIFGAALLYGDGIITPAISVLSAIEGLKVATESASSFILPLTCVVLLLLFLVQRHGTAGIGKVFGPIVLIWFAAIAALGIAAIKSNPHILIALNPLYAISFFAENRLHGMVVLGSVVLCITGGEALYADLGHFGTKAIRLSWFSIAFPALLLNYFGQGALLLDNPDFAFNPFYGLVPKSFLYPMVALSTMATVIASQAMITGVFSLTQQAVQLGFSPRMHIVHTSSETRGQIYVPHINYALMLACIGLVLAFRESSRLAGAYGIAVTATMGITSVLYFFVTTRRWQWSLWKAIPLVGIFIVFDLAYFGSNLLKLADGGWFTLAVGAVIMIAMTTWRDGRAELARKMLSTRFPLSLFIEDVAQKNPQRVQGTAVFMTVSPVGTPSALLHHFKHNHVLHEKIILLSVRSVDFPTLPDDERLNMEDLGQGFYRIVAFYGFREMPDVPEVLKMASRFGIQIEPSATTYFLGRETLLTTGDSKMMQWRKTLFSFMSRNAWTAPAYFGIPSDRVIEIGVQIEL